uniref:Testis-specific serine/threonine-protein kinase 2-like n=1 Tax=Saccoglossus kowalevskii TaxID=10224 RepID=A0ABM0GWA6_SACKO|nr:PREDICTED: testis-specific serine/threonine-protein kinase 2-like [Saccoglossus kowalevskii]
MRYVLKDSGSIQHKLGTSDNILVTLLYTCHLDNMEHDGTNVNMNEQVQQQETTRATRECPKDRDILRSRGLMVGESLGYGSYSKVKFAIETKTMRKIAVKIIDRRKAPRDFLQNFLPRELDILPNLKHEGIILTYGYFEENNKIFITQELAENGDMLTYIRGAGSALPERLAKQWILEMTEALDYLNKQCLVHRDLKCENILLDSNMHVKIGDFGFARKIGEHELSKTYCGSAAYAAPEILQSLPYSPAKSDIWALGVIMYILTCGEMPFGDDSMNVSKILHRQMDGIRFPLLRRITPECRKLIEAMLTIDPDKRINLEGVLASAWLNPPDNKTPN